MNLSQLLAGENPIIHKSWAMGEHLAKSKDNGLWMKYPASYEFSLPVEFDTEKAIANDDGSYFTMPPKRPTYEEIADLLNVNDCKQINLVAYVEGGILHNVWSSSENVSIEVVDYDDLEAEGLDSEERTEKLEEAKAENNANHMVW